jgi:hypothetical protein
MLAVYSVVRNFDIWSVFDNLFKAGPGGKSYIEAHRKYAQSSSSSESQWILSNILGDAIMTAADILMVGGDTVSEMCLRLNAVSNLGLALLYHLDQTEIGYVSPLSCVHWRYW